MMLAAAIVAAFGLARLQQQPRAGQRRCRFTPHRNPRYRRQYENHRPRVPTAARRQSELRRPQSGIPLQRPCRAGFR